MKPTLFNRLAISSSSVFIPLLLMVIAHVPAGLRADKEDSKAGTLVIGLLSDPGTLNPLSATSSQAKDIIERLFLKLLEEQSDFLHFRPRLAERWEFSQDSLDIRFYLRKDVKWSDGAPCTARDVSFTWECHKDTVVSWQGRHLKDRISDVVVEDDYKVTFHFTSRYPYQLMDANDGVILPEHLLGMIPRSKLRTCDFGRRPVGNGPFVLSRWISGQYVELKSNPDYYEQGKPFLGRVVFRIVPDMLTLTSQLKTGAIDCLESLSPDEADNVRNNHGELKIYEYPSRNMAFVAWNLTRELFKEKVIRRALAMAINRQAIIENVWRGKAAECTSPMHPILWAFDDSIEPIPYDPRQAGQILHRNGWEDLDGDGILEKGGIRFEFEMIANYGNQQRTDAMIMIQAQLKEIGIKVNTRVLEWNIFIDRIIKSEFDSCVMGWKVGTRADLSEFWHSSAARQGGFNISGYKIEEADRLIEKARNTLDVEEAKQLWSKCQRLIYEDQPFLFLAIPSEINCLKRSFADVEPSPISFFYNLRSWKVAP